MVPAGARAFTRSMHQTPTPLPILVTGGTGKTGRRVAAGLESLGLPVRIGSRSAEIPFDWDDDATWGPVLDGVGAAFVAYAPELAFPGAAEVVRSFSRQAVACGVRRLVLLSGRGEAGAHRAEQFVMASGAEWTIVRCAVFAQNFDEGMFAAAIQAGVLAVPAGEVAEPFLDVNDIADVVIDALTDDRHAGQLYELTGPRLLTFAEAAALIGEAAGHPVEYVPVTGEAFEADLRAAGLPDEEAQGITWLFGEIFDGRNQSLSDGVQQALGRPPRDFADYARRAAATGVWSPQPVR
jgi:uncharacterized protein YbjT (DUF2867 family)